MPHSLRARLSWLRYKKMISDKDYGRLCKALDLEKAIKDIKTEISKQEIECRKQNDRCGIGLDMALRIIDKRIAEGAIRNETDN